MKIKIVYAAVCLLLCAAGARAQSTNSTNVVNTSLRTGVYVIFVILDTNKVEVGTLTTTGGKERWRVVEDWYITNTIAVLEYEHQQRIMLLKVEKGPFIKERREPKEAMMPPPMPKP